MVLTNGKWALTMVLKEPLFPFGAWREHCSLGCSLGIRKFSRGATKGKNSSLRHEKGGTNGLPRFSSKTKQLLPSS